MGRFMFAVQWLALALAFAGLLAAAAADTSFEQRRVSRGFLVGRRLLTRLLARSEKKPHSPGFVRLADKTSDNT